MACSHEGDPNLGRKIIEAAAAAQADAVQFQIWLAKDVMVPHHPDFEKLTCIQLSREAWTQLAQHARACRPQMQIIACVYERSSVDFAEDLEVDAYKVHAADLSNPLLMKYVAQTGKRIDLSVGASTLTEIQTAIDWIRETSTSNIWLMYGYQNFPTRTDDVHLDHMMKLRDLFELPVAYQDHSDAGGLSRQVRRDRRAMHVRNHVVRIGHAHGLFAGLAFGAGSAVGPEVDHLRIGRHRHTNKS